MAIPPPDVVSGDLASRSGLDADSSGTPRSVTGSSVRSAPAINGRLAFFDPSIAMRPLSRAPPEIRNASMSVVILASWS